MTNVAAINVSPRKRGTSAMLLDLLKSDLDNRGDSVQIVNLYSHLKDMKTVFDAVGAADTIVISGPCYVNSYPADTTKLLLELAARPGILHGQKLYGLIQGGMPYAHTHVSGLNMLKVFAKKVNIPYQGGFLMGLGAMLDGRHPEKLPNGKKVVKQLSLFYEYIHNGEKSPDALYEKALLKLPGVFFYAMALLMNRRIDKAYAARGMDAHEPSPYLKDDINVKS